MEPVPEGNEEWEECPGLSRERTIEIALRIHEIAISQKSYKKKGTLV
jgi:hypothetical protein